MGSDHYTRHKLAPRDKPCYTAILSTSKTIKDRLIVDTPCFVFRGNQVSFKNLRGGKRYSPNNRSIEPPRPTLSGH